MTSHDEGVQVTETPQTNHTQYNSEESKETQANKHESQSTQRKSQGRDHEQENDDGKDKVKKQEESNDGHGNNEGKEGSEKEGSQQQSGEGKSGNGNGNGDGGSKHPKVSKEALEGPQSPAPTTKYDFEAEAKNDGSGKNTGKNEAGKPKDQKNQSPGSDDKKDGSSEHKHGGTLGHIKDKMHEHLGR